MSKLLFLFLLQISAALFLLFNISSAEELPSLGVLFVPAIVISLLIILNGLFVLAEFAIIGVRPSQIEQMANKGNRTARLILTILRSPARQNRYLTTAQLGITIASLGLGMYGEPQVAHFIEPYLAWMFGFESQEGVVETIGYLIALGVLTSLHIVLGEMVPKSLALAAPRRSVFTIFRPMYLIQLLFAVPVYVLNQFSLFLLRIFRIPPVEAQARLHSPEELEFIVSESAEEGVLDESEVEIIHRILDFGDRQVHQVMTPRPRLQALAHDTPLPELLQRMMESEYSRLPVYEGDLDNIIGVLHIKDIVCHQLRAGDNFDKRNFDIRLLLRSVPVVPEHYPVEKLLLTFKRQHIHIAVVLNEYGGTAGIVTLEDLVEEIVGEVRDEFDIEVEPIVEHEPGLLEVAGHYLIDNLAEYVPLGDKEALPDVETVSGLIMTELGRLPQVGDEVIYADDVHFTVLALEGRTVGRAEVRYPASEKIDGRKNSR